MENKKRDIKKHKFTPVQTLAIGFALLIFVGAILLTLPISSKSGKTTPFLTALFTSTSAVCVTGLVVVDTGTYWSYFGKLVIMILIETGGLGFMSFTTLVAFVFGKRITLRQRLVMQEALNSFSIQGLVKLVKYLLIGTFSIEAIGASLLAIKFIPEYGIRKGIFFSIFHSVSAYCNAGFDLIGNFNGLVPFQSNFVINFTIMALIILGGLGFIVQSEIYEYRNFKKFSLHTKVVIFTTILLIIIGAILFFALESSNPDTMEPLSIGGKVLASFFASVTPRTAGFNTLDTTKMTIASKVITIILMFIGASPGSTGGGIKTTTAAALFMTVVSVIKGRQDTEILNKRLPKEIIYRALSVVAISLTVVVIDVIILSITEKGAQFIELLYETTSAFGTVGLSLNFTTRLSIVGKIIITLTMYIGRVGPMTIALALARKQRNSNSSIKYPEDKILIG